MTSVVDLKKELDNAETSYREETKILKEKFRAAQDAYVNALKDKGITGVLNNVRFTTNPDGVNVSGYVEIDTRNRFFFRDFVHTSIVKRVYQEDGLWFVKTHYSLYQVEWAEGETIPEEFLTGE